MPHLKKGYLPPSAIIVLAGICLFVALTLLFNAQLLRNINKQREQNKITPSVQPTVSPTSNWETFYSPFGDFSLKAPPSWTLEKEPKSTQLTKLTYIKSKDYTQSAPTEPGMFIPLVLKGDKLDIRVEQNQYFKNYEEYKKFLETVSTGFPSKSLSSDEIMVSGEKCLLVTGGDSRGNQAYCFMFHNGKTYDLVLRSNTANFEMLTQILSTFKFTQ